MNENLILLSQSYNDNKALRLLIKLAPYGGLIDSTLSSFYIREKERRLKVFFDELERSQISLTDEEIQNNDFLHKYFITLKAAVNTKRDEKIQYFARLLQNSNSPLLNPDLDTYDDFLGILDELTFQEIYILLSIRKFFAEYTGGKGLNNVAMYRPLKAKLAEEMKVSENEIISYYVRLERTGLIHHFRDQFMSKEVNDTVNLTETFRKLETLAHM
jgi:hypothetical protein